MKFIFAFVGVLTGLTLSRSIFISYNVDMSSVIVIGTIVVSSICFGLLFFTFGGKIVELIISVADKTEKIMQQLTLYELLMASIGLIAGLIVANLVSIPISKIDIIGVPLAIMINILLGFSGVFLVLSKRNDNLFQSMKKNIEGASAIKNSSNKKILDTSVIIDGRILDIYKSGFLEGELIVPSFVLEELRHLADSQDDLKRGKGRRGLDILNIIKQELGERIPIENIKKEEN